MSLSLTKIFHLEFLSRYFPLPDADRKKPFVPAGLTGVSGATHFSGGFPDECLVDHLFTTQEDVDAARFRLLDAYLAQDLNTGWLGASKTPITKEADCGFKQGFCKDKKFLVDLYTSRQSSAPAWKPHFFGYHTNVGGAPFVIDLDFKEGEKDAVQTFFAFLEKNGIDPRSFPCVMTQGGGLHLYFQSYAGEHASRANFSPEVWGAGVDIRGNGALVLAAGSFAWVDGKFKQYTVVNNAPLPPLPACVVEVIESYNKKKKQFIVPPVAGTCAFEGDGELDRACRIVAKTPEGNRNDMLNKISFAMGKLIRDSKVNEQEVEEKLMQAALQSGLSDGEAMKTIASGMEKRKG